MFLTIARATYHAVVRLSKFSVARASGADLTGETPAPLPSPVDLAWM
jgi:hypothetical protein